MYCKYTIWQTCSIFALLTYNSLFFSVCLGEKKMGTNILRIHFNVDFFVQHILLFFPIVLRFYYVFHQNLFEFCSSFKHKTERRRDHLLLMTQHVDASMCLNLTAYWMCSNNIHFGFCAFFISSIVCCLRIWFDCGKYTTGNRNVLKKLNSLQSWSLYRNTDT